jgi:adenylate cyclase
VQDRLGFEFEELGALSLKNIGRPIEAYVLRLDIGAVATASKYAARLARGNSDTLPLADRPSMAVLPFSNLSGDIEQEYFADGVADDIITELSRSHSLLVIARNSSFTYRGRAVDVKQVARELGVRYVVEGSVRRSSSRIRVTAQLIDAETGNHIWAERYDRALEDVFAVQDEITKAVVMAVQPAVADAELRRALRRPPENLGAWEAYQRGLWHRSKFKLDDLPRAREFFVRAMGLDPTLAAAYTGLAWLYLQEAHWFGSRSFAEGAVLAAEQARKAIDIDSNDAEAHGVLASALFSSGDFKAASDHAQQALSISPSCAFAQHTRGAILLFSGHPAEGREILLLARRLDPRLLGAVIQAQIAMSYYYVSDYEDAVSTLGSLLSERPDHPWAYRWLAAALGQLGRTDEARDALSKAIATAPEAFYAFLRNRPPWVRPEDYEHMLDGLRKAGWEG